MSDDGVHVVGLIEELRIEGSIVPNRRGELYRLSADWIEQLERENLELQHDLEQSLANHVADLKSAIAIDIVAAVLLLAVGIASAWYILSPLFA